VPQRSPKSVDVTISASAGGVTVSTVLTVVKMLGNGGDGHGGPPKS
jgi:hypothetical protein